MSKTFEKHHLSKKTRSNGTPNYCGQRTIGWIGGCNGYFQRDVQRTLSSSWRWREACLHHCKGFEISNQLKLVYGELSERFWTLVIAPYQYDHEIHPHPHHQLRVIFSTANSSTVWISNFVKCTRFILTQFKIVSRSEHDERNMNLGKT